MTAELEPENEFEAEGGELVKELARRFGADWLRADESQPVAVLERPSGGACVRTGEGPERAWFFFDAEAAFGMVVYRLAGESFFEPGDRVWAADVRFDGAWINPRPLTVPGDPELN